MDGLRWVGVGGWVGGTDLDKGDDRGRGGRRNTAIVQDARREEEAEGGRHDASEQEEVLGE